MCRRSFENKQTERHAIIENSAMVNAPVITVPAFASAGSGVRHFFGTRRHATGLTVDVGVPIQRLSGIPRSTWLLSVKQVHGTDALVVDRSLTPDDRFHGGWDALVTDQPGVMVAVRTADCVPVLIHDSQQRVVAAVHAGWRGAVAGIVGKTIGLMQSRFGSNPSHLRVSIGPSAGACCYEVDEPVLVQLRREVPGWEKVVGRRSGRTYLDLKALIKEQVQAIGTRPEATTTVNLCTICHRDLFFSYRREGKVIGTMVSAIGLAPVRG
jgi:polyphenol oxidase